MVAALPSEVVREWLDGAGVEGARRIARHLPPPTLGPDGMPVVAPLTEWVLETFEDDDEPEDWGWWVIDKTAESVISGIPYVREIPNSKFGGGNTPIGSFAHDAWDLYIQAGQGDLDAALRRKIITTGGTLFHLPASQPNRFFDQVWAEDDPEWYEYFIGERD